jgi:hypothetical protein
VIRSQKSGVRSQESEVRMHCHEYKPYFLDGWVNFSIRFIKIPLYLPFKGGSMMFLLMQR